MFNIAKPFFIRVITPLHVGSGSDLGIIDLPIQRERHTGYPKIESSGLKGCIREAFENNKYGEKNINNIVSEDGNSSDDNKKKIIDGIIDELFGPENAGNNAHAGALGFTDARILLFPVKSMKGVYALVTCPKVIKKFIEEAGLCGDNYKFTINNDKSKEYDPQDNTVSNKDHLLVHNKLILEEYLFEMSKGDNTNKFAVWLSEKTGINDIKDKLVILPDNDFRDFVTISTEVNTRIKINPETGTVQTGALFTEEFLPAETVLYSLALASKVFKRNRETLNINKYKESSANKESNEENIVMRFFKENLPSHLQIGGDATLGKGIVKTKIMEGQNNDKQQNSND